MNKTLSLISRNELYPSFWVEHLRTNSLQISKVDSFQSLDINRNWPDAILIDDYFTSEGDVSWMRCAVDSLRLAGYDNKIFCVSPLFLKEGLSICPSIPEADCHPFSQELLRELRGIERNHTPQQIA